MADLTTGADAEVDNCLSIQQYNRIKNHWRQADPCANLANIQPGMIVSDSDDEKLYHYQAAACFEIIQGDTPISDDLQIIGGDGSDSILIPYEGTINDAIIWGLPIDPKRGLIFCDVADIGGDFTAITPTGFPQINVVDLDLDSFIEFSFTADDKPTIKLQSGVYYSLIQESQAEGLAGADLRIGLGESLRSLIICDTGDIGDDFGFPAWFDPTLTIFNAGGTVSTRWDASKTVFATGYILRGTRLTFEQTGDLTAGDQYTFTHQNAGQELTDQDAEQAFLKIEPFIGQGGTAWYIGLLMDVTENSLGSGVNELMALRVATVDKFTVDNKGYAKGGTLSGALADNDTFVTTIPDTWTGIVIVENVTDTTSGVYHIDGAALTVINQNAAFTTAQGTNDKINVYIAANVLTVENTWAAAKTVKVFFIGT